jgi:cation:H+ antiporter
VSLNLTLLVVSIGALGLGSQWLVSGASSIARNLGVSEFIIGITIVAVGTSLPEIATSVAAVIRREHDIAVGNAIGSCIVNLLGVLGLMAVISGKGIAVPTGALTFDFPVMIATAVACLPIFFSDHRISRWEGALLLAYYVAYAGFLVLKATDHESVPMFSGIMLAFVIPITVITFGIVTWKGVLARRAAGRSEVKNRGID